MLTLVMAVLPGDETPQVFPWDKASHVSAFYLLTLLAVAGGPLTDLLWVAVGLSALGGLIELIQALPIVHRDCSVWDWVADTVGVVSVLLPIVLVQSRMRALVAARGRMPDSED